MSGIDCDAILGEARDKLLDRRKVVAELVDRAKAELAGIDAALRRLGVKPTARRAPAGPPERRSSPASASSPAAATRRPPTDRPESSPRSRILQLLRQRDEPLRPAEIAEEVGGTPAGVGACLRAAERDGEARKREDGTWVATPSLGRVIGDATEDDEEELGKLMRQP